MISQHKLAFQFEVHIYGFVCDLAEQSWAQFACGFSLSTSEVCGLALSPWEQPSDSVGG